MPVPHWSHAGKVPSESHWPSQLRVRAWATLDSAPTGMYFSASGYLAFGVSHITNASTIC